MIDEFKDEIKGLKNILNEIKKSRIIKRTRNKWKLNMLDHEINDILEKLYVDLTSLFTTKMWIFWKTWWIWFH